MLITITIAGHIQAQGNKVADLPDGRVTISTGKNRFTGWPILRQVRA